MTQQDIEAELSYAYLHAVASRAGVACQYCSRTFDSAGVDAELLAVQDFGPDALTDIAIHVQMKATVATPSEREGQLAYFIDGIDAYNKLRAETVAVPRLLVVLFLPENAEEWLAHTEDQLVLKRCAYWVSLRGAPETANTTGQTVHLPRGQGFSPEALTALMGRMARREELRYEA